MHRKNVHAIGDRANGLVLDAFEKALDGVDVVALRPRLEHAQLLSESDMKRFGKLGGELGSLQFDSLLNVVASQLSPVSNQPMCMSFDRSSQIR